MTPLPVFRSKTYQFIYLSVQFSRSVVSDSLRPHGLHGVLDGQASLSITNSQRLLKLMSIKSIRPSNHLILCRPLLLLLILPSIRVFQMSQLFTSGGQSIGVSVSTSLLPMNTQDWSPLVWTGWIFLQSKRLSEVFSNTTVQKASILRCSAFLIVQLSHP